MMETRQTLFELAGMIHVCEWKGVHSQSTESEYTHETNLLTAWELELLQSGHWESKDHEVGNDVETRVGKPDTHLAHAVASFDLEVPEEGHR